MPTAFHEQKLLVCKLDFHYSQVSRDTTVSLDPLSTMSSTATTDTLPRSPLRRQSAPSAYFPPRRSSTSTGLLPSIPERTPTMIPVEEEPVPVVVEPPKGHNWHHLPIVFALLPAAAGLFVGGGEKWTDVMLLGLVGVYLNWLVKCNYYILDLVLILVPWEWYHASRTLRLMSDFQNSPTPFFAGTEGFVSTPLESAIASEDEDETPTLSQHNPTNNTLTLPDSETEAAAMNLRRTELLALTSCFASPLIGGYLLHYVREFLSRPSEGLVSTFNITLFVMAAELRPAMKLMEMIKQRSLYLQKIVHKDMLESNVNNNNSPVVDIEPLNQKIEHLENTIEELRMSIVRVQGGREEVVTGVREGVRADVEALNRIFSRQKRPNHRCCSSI